MGAVQEQSSSEVRVFKFESDEGGPFPLGEETREKALELIRGKGSGMLYSKEPGKFFWEKWEPITGRE